MNKAGNGPWLWCAGGVAGILDPILLFYGVNDLSDPIRQVPLASIFLAAIIFLILRKRWYAFSVGMLIGVLVGNIVAIELFVTMAKGALGGGFL